jgi:hypothetical protein
MQDNIEDAIDQNVSNIGGEEYDDTATYEVGDIVKYEGQLYICIEAVETAETFDNTKWNATDVLSSAGGNEIAIGTNADITGKTKLFVEESTQTLKYKSSTTGQFENLTSEDIVIGEPEDVTSETKIFINEEEGTDAYSEVVNSLAGDEIAKAPSVHAVNEAIPQLTRKTYTTTATANSAVTPYNAYAYVDITSDKALYGNVISIYAFDEYGVGLPCAYGLFNNQQDRISISANLSAPNIIVSVTYMK